MIELDIVCTLCLRVCVHVCVAQVILTSVQIRMQTPESSRMSLQDPNSSPVPIIPWWHAVSRWQLASSRSDMDSCFHFVLQSGWVNRRIPAHPECSIQSSLCCDHQTLNITFWWLNVISSTGWRSSSLLEPHWGAAFWSSWMSESFSFGSNLSAFSPSSTQQERGGDGSKNFCSLSVRFPKKHPIQPNSRNLRN